MSPHTDILATLTYFDLFHYPLTAVELRLFSHHTHTPAAIGAALRELLAAKQVYCFDELYTLHNDPSLAPRRRAGNAKARALLHTAGKVARLVSCFPFVRGVAVSGSLSKNWADERSDIDLFIITAPNRLWLARTLLHGLKKLSYLAGRQHHFCMNYFVDECALEIREKNLYTATEIVTLLPLRGIGAFDAFFRQNAWTRNYLPNFSMRVSYLEETRRHPLRRAVECSLNNAAGNALDSLLWRITARRWSRKTERGRRNSRGIVMSMAAGKHFAKPDPAQFQNKLMARYEAGVFGIYTAQPQSLRPVC
ncbi:hypothetical protein [Flaviaesturariibacter amylovorans]|uniref:hypothetical protein n=1 Tax=Flaviaesturariibacter amylovorans TaxID=1084520 RepID=UPI0031EAAA53